MRRRGEENELQPAQVSDWRELAQRIDDRVAITLLRSERGNRVKLAVADQRTGHRLEIDIRASEAAPAPWDDAEEWE